MINESDSDFHELAFPEGFFAFLIGQGVADDLKILFIEVVIADVHLPQRMRHLDIQAQFPYRHRGQ